MPQSELRDQAFQRIQTQLFAGDGPLPLGPVFEACARRAERERVAPLLYYACEASGWPSHATSAHKRRLRQQYLNSAASNVTLLDALDDISRALSLEGIRCLAVKGADLGTRLYPNVALRPMSDIDLLVAPDDAMRAQSVVEQLGYRAWCPEMTPGLTTRIRHARLFVGGAANRVQLDLHWSLVGNATDERAAPVTWFLVESEPNPEPGLRPKCTWLRLSATSHLLYLAAHMKLQHYGETPPLLWLVDFYLLAHAPEVDFERLVDRAEAFGWTQALAAAARDTKNGLALELPRSLERLLEKTNEDARDVGGAHGPRRGRERVVNELFTLPWRGRWLLVRALVWPSSEYLRWRYPQHQKMSWPLIHILRGFHVISGGIRIVAGWLKRRKGPELNRP